MQRIIYIICTYTYTDIQHDFLSDNIRIFYKIIKTSHNISAMQLISWKLQHCPITDQEYETTTIEWSIEHHTAN
jgi:hypothetical protein